MKINSDKLKNLYIEFFKQKGHKVIPNVSLIPENDPTVLFTTAGMHPLVPFLLGQSHPQGKRLVNVQKSFRTTDIDEVGDSFHLSFFEMLGNWSLGDYFKKDAITWSFEFLTSKKWLGLDRERLYITVFAGDKDAPKDEESCRVWKSLGIPDKRIFFLPKNENWWGPAGNTGPCGPCTEMFYDTGKKPCGDDCKPGCSCGKYFEIWNDVFMEYNKTAEGKYELLDQKNVDTGMGVERTVAVLQGKNSVYEIEEFKPIVNMIKKIAKITDEQQEKSVRIIADHTRAATFILAENIVPKNVEQGYTLRRLIRRSIRYGKLLGIEKGFLSEIAKTVINIHKKNYPYLDENKNFILDELKKEELKFRNTLAKGLRKFNEIYNSAITQLQEGAKIDGKNAFLLFQSYGFPIEMTKELAEERGISVDVKGFEEEFKKHQKISKAGAEKKFGSGLADTSEQTIKLHTTTHLLNEALRRVLKKRDIIQKGSNITAKRLRFDFNFDRKLTKKEIKDVEDLVNKQIKKALPVKRIETTLEEAKRMGAQAVFEQKYGEKVFVYFIGDFSLEICSGPHVNNTKELGKFKIVKEEGISSGVRRIKAILES
jgi:alanyl-tRNA synthetase